MKTTAQLSLFVTLFFAILAEVNAEVVMPTIFSDHMVLQRAEKAPVWGRASPDEQISVKMDNQSVQTKTGPDGKWQVLLDLRSEGPGPFEMTVQGENKIVISDVLVGDVWFAGGQSNMEFRLNRATGGPAEIAQSSNPMLRQFTVAKVASKVPLDTLAGKWIVASPQSSAGFTAVGYYFAKQIQSTLKSPVGLISDNWGGTPAEAWTRKEALDVIPGISTRRDQQWQEEELFQTQKPIYLSALTSWLKDHHLDDQPAGDVARFLGDDVSVKWTLVKLPGRITNADLPETGIFWVKKEMTLNGAAVHEPLHFPFTPSNCYESLYCNGQLVEQVTPKDLADPVHQPDIPVAMLKEGINQIAMRLYAPITSPTLAVPSLVGDWQVAVEKAFPVTNAETQASAPKPPALPIATRKIASALYNGMIQPLIPYGIKGVIWYQGEDNVSRAYDYRTVFRILIADWRTQWGQGTFPFYFCQLANYLPKKNVAGESSWAELREAQSFALTLPDTGEAVLIDAGDSDNIHPRDKQTPGERLALLALAHDYGQSKLICFGPVYASMKVEGDKIRLSFSPGEGLSAKSMTTTYSVDSASGKTAPLERNSPGSALEGFAICGADRKWEWAEAKIDGTEVVVSSDKVPVPVAVRYDWSDNPSGNLYGSAGLPASPFRTDDFPGITVNAHY